MSHLNIMYHTISDTPIIDWYRSLSSSIGISYFLKNMIDIVLIMSFLVIIASLIAFMILIIIEKMFTFIERIRNQKVDTGIISDQY